MRFGCRAHRRTAQNDTVEGEPGWENICMYFLHLLPSHIQVAGQQTKWKQKNGIGMALVWCTYHDASQFILLPIFFFFCSCYLSHRRSATTTPKPAVSLCALWLTVARCALKYRQSHSLWLLWSVQALGKRNTFPLSTTNRKFRMRGVSFLHVTLE